MIIRDWVKKLQLPSIDLRVLGIYFAVLGLLYFTVLVYENYRIIRSQRTEIAVLQTQLKSIREQRSELEFIRDSLYAHEPYFYINALRKDWGFRKEREVTLSELPERSRICRGVPIYTIMPRKTRNVSNSKDSIFMLVAGGAISALVFMLLFSFIVQKPKRSDPVGEIRSIMNLDNVPVTAVPKSRRLVSDDERSPVEFKGEIDRIPYA